VPIKAGSLQKHTLIKNKLNTNTGAYVK